MATYPPPGPSYGDGGYAQYSPQYPNHQQDATRPPPPTGPPPAYDVRRIYPYTLRPVLLFTCGLSMIYLCITGTASIRDATRSGSSGKLKLYEFIEAGLYFGAAGVELFGIYSTWVARIPQARLYSLLSVGAFGVVVAAELLDTITHFSYKSAVIDACTLNDTGKIADSDDNFGGFFDNDNNGLPLTADQARSLCSNQWKRESIWDIVWLLVTIFLGAIFVSFSFSFVRQLLDPSSVPARAPRPNRFQGPSDYGGPNVPHMPYDAEAAAAYGGGGGASGLYNPPPGVPPSGGGPPLYDGPGRSDADDKSPSGPGPSGGRGYGYGYGMGGRHEEYGASNETLGVGSGKKGAYDDDDEEEDRRSVDTVIDNGPEADRKSAKV